MSANDQGPPCSQSDVLGDMGGSAESDALLTLAEQVMGWKVYRERPDNPDELHHNLPCAVLDEVEGMPMLMVYSQAATLEHGGAGDEKKADIKTEHYVFGTYWNPFREIHDAWQLLEALQREAMTSGDADRMLDIESALGGLVFLSPLQACRAICAAVLETIVV